MGFKKELNVCLLSVLFIAACGQSHTNTDSLAMSLRSTPTSGESLGAPESEDAVELEEQIAQYLQVDDKESSEKDFTQWSDAELEEVYSSEWDSINVALDTFSTLGVLENSQTSVMGAAKKKKSGGMSGMACLGLGIQGEAGGESLQGMIAVGRTILKRAGGSMGRVCAALFARSQFESMQKRNRKVSAASLRAAQQSAKLGSWPYDHFINKVLQRKMGRKIPKWVVNFERRGCLVKNVGLHTFYASQNCKRK
jgi:hypothetical protein